MLVPPSTHCSFNVARRHFHTLPQCFQGSVPLRYFSFPSLLLIIPYSTALSKQFCASLETTSVVPSPPLAKTERISSTSLSMSVSARCLSACIMFWMMTTPRWRRSGISLSNSACIISSQWVVWQGKRKQWGLELSHVIFLAHLCLLFRGCECKAPAALPLAWPEFLRQLGASVRPLLQSRARPAWGDRFPWPKTSSEPGNTSVRQLIFPSMHLIIIHNSRILSHLCAQHQITHAFSGRRSNQFMLLEHVAFYFRNRFLLYDLLPVKEHPVMWIHPEASWVQHTWQEIKFTQRLVQLSTWNLREELRLVANLSLSLRPAKLVRAMSASKFCSRLHSRLRRLMRGRTVS